MSRFAPISKMANPTHKSATSVTLAPLAEKSTFEQFVSKYWLHGLGIFLAIAGYVIYRHQAETTRKEARDKSWEAMDSRTDLAGFPRIPDGTPEEMASLSAELKGTDAGPWSRWLEANALLGERKFDEAKAVLETLKSEYPEHPLVKQVWSVDGTSESLVTAFASSIAVRKAWEEQHANLFANPPPAADAPKVRLKTELGDIEVALYRDRAPEHVQNFLDLVGSGYYSGTKFHRIDAQMGVDGGDPLSREDEPTRWGTGGGDKVLTFKDTGLYHFKGVLTAAAGTTPKESLGSRFSLLTEDRHDLDGQRVVFGVVTGGMDIVRQLANAAQASDGSGRPEKPVLLSSVEIVP